VHVLAFHVQIAPHRSFPLPTLLGEPVVVRIHLVGRIGAPGPVRFREVVPQADASGAQEAVADVPLLPGERIANLAVLQLQVRIETRAVPAELVEIQRASRLDAVDRGVVEVAGRLAVRADRNVIDDVVDLAAIEAERRRSELAEVVDAFDLKVPLTDIVVAHLGEPRRGDIVTFSSPRDGVRLIKRLVAVPGDTVAMRNKVLVVNGQAATYAPIGTAVEQPAPGMTIQALRFNEITKAGEHVVQWFHLPDGSLDDSFGPVVLPAGRYLMLGDNRDDSADSRYFGLVPRELLIGRAVAIVASADIKGNWAPRFERFGERLR